LSAKEKMFSSFTFPSGVKVKNRVIMAPMTNFGSHDDGTVSESELSYYRKRAGGVGTVITACAYVTPSGKGFQGEFGAHNDSMIDSLKSLASTIKGEGAKAILQIFHGGRMCPPELVPNGEIVSASAVPAEREGAQTPRELMEDEIESIIQDFGHAARRAVEAGFDGVELHGANTFLIQQFFSPHSNRRSDKWGGTLENRLRFPLAVIEEVKKAVNKATNAPFIIGYRLSPEERENPGITMEDTLTLVDVLTNQELDYIHLSLGEFFQSSMRDKESTTPIIEMIKEKVNGRTPIIGVGSIYSAEDAEKAFSFDIPLIALGRELIIDPQWVQKMESGRENEIETELDPTAQEQLVVPDSLWNAIINSPGWFPIKKQ